MPPKLDPAQPGQRSVGEFPRPAIAQASDAHIRIEHRGMIVAETRNSICTYETSHPPSYYIPPQDVAPELLRRASGSSFWEWKGAASYWDVVIGDEVLQRVGWSYASPSASFTTLRNHITFYAGPFDKCTVDDENVIP